MAAGGVLQLAFFDVTAQLQDRTRPVEVRITVLSWTVSEGELDGARSHQNPEGPRRWCSFPTTMRAGLHCRSSDGEGISGLTDCEQGQKRELQSKPSHNVGASQLEHRANRSGGVKKRESLRVWESWSLDPTKFRVLLVINCASMRSESSID